MTYGYSSKENFSNYFPHSHRLITQLAERRSIEAKDRPIIFVTHSLGGLIVKSALVHASASVTDCENGPKSIQLSTIGGM